MTRRARSLRFRIVASLVLFLVFGVAAELFARWLGPELPSWRGADTAGVVMTANPTRLWGLSPGERKNGPAIATVNALGLRGDVPEVPRPAGRQRILVLGDSTWFGHGVADSETFPAQLQARLRAAGIDVDVVNGAVPGYSTEQSRLLLEEVGWSVEPTLLLVGSLWSDNTVDTFKDADLLKTARAAKNPLFKSAFFRLLATWIDGARGGTGARLVTWTQKSEWPKTVGRRVPIQDYAANLDAMAREAAERKVGIAFVSPCNVGLVRGEYSDGASWDVYFETQRAVAMHHGVPAIATLPAMKSSGVDPDALFVDVMHPSAQGHAIFAEAVASALTAAGWPTTPLLAAGSPFPVADLVDRAPQVGQPATGSPQRNLFVDTSKLQPVAPTSDPAPHDGKPLADGAPASGATNNPAAGNRWTVHGRIEGGTGPFQVELRRPEGGVVSSAHVAESGDFTLSVRGDLPTVKVRVVDSLGHEDQVEATSASDRVDLSPR